jgi:2-C-methyl-D-erythritol 2,4-cyclodiphosphate synthase
MTSRIGHGFDVHAFDDGNQGVDKIIIGGVAIPYERGLVAHSDGDVLLHALCDALLGAVALGDIGKHFPDTDAAYKNADSRALLRMVYQKVKAKGFQLSNVDMTIVAQAPKMATYIDDMRRHIAKDLDCDIDVINVKATTTEKLGYVGRKEGIAAHAVVLLNS